MSLPPADFTPVGDELNRIGGGIVAAALAVHRVLGAGLLESVYEACLCDELEMAGLSIQRQVVVPIIYRGREFQEGFRADIVVAGRVIVEIKSVEQLKPVHEAQLLTYLRFTRCRLGYLINFNVPLIKSGIRRLVL